VVQDLIKPDKGNGIVLMKLTDYQTSMTALFSDPKKFSKLHNDPSLTLTTFFSSKLSTDNSQPQRN
jgi:hypothetical protein